MEVECSTLAVAVGGSAAQAEACCCEASEEADRHSCADAQEVRAANAARPVGANRMAHSAADTNGQAGELPWAASSAGAVAAAQL